LGENLALIDVDFPVVEEAAQTPERKGNGEGGCEDTESGSPNSARDRTFAKQGKYGSSGEENPDKEGGAQAKIHEMQSEEIKCSWKKIEETPQMPEKSTLTCERVSIQDPKLGAKPLANGEIFHRQQPVALARFRCRNIVVGDGCIGIHTSLRQCIFTQQTWGFPPGGCARKQDGSVWPTLLYP